MKAILILFLNILAQISFSKGQIYLTPQQVQQGKFDYIIVGGGTGGATVAKRLSENLDWKILIIEAGGRPGPLSYIPAFFLFQSFSPAEWQYPIEPSTECFKSYPGQKVSYSQAKMLGGGSSHNDMIYVRGSKENFDSWADAGLDEWRYENVLPFFIKAEDNTIPEQMINKQYHGTKGPLTVSQLSYVSPMLKTFIDGGKLIGLPLVDYNAANQTGVAPMDFTIRNGSRCSTYEAYLNSIPTRTNLFISIYSTATRIIFNNKNATGVTFINNGSTFQATVDREVIISCGTLASPKLLMLSGIGDKEQLRKFKITVVADRPGVGANLFDHVSNFALVAKLNCTDCTYQLTNAVSLTALINYEMANAGPLSSPLGIEGTAFFKSNQSLKTNDIQFFFLSNSFATIPAAFSLLIGADANVLTQYFAPFANATSTITILVANVQPKSVGYVRLNSSDPLAYPLINFNYMNDPADATALIEGMKMAKKLIDSKAFQSVGAQLLPGPYPGCENYTMYTNDYWNCFIRGLNDVMLHPVGTCKMGLANDRMAVVDQYLKVIGVKNLRMVDASVMPYITSGNTNAPTNMIGERAAAFIQSGK